MNQALNDSQFNMWRAMVALVMADNEEHPSEVQFFHERFEKLAMSEEQKSQLLADLGSRKPVSEFFDGITEPRDRSLFIMFARQLFWSDGDFSEQEKEIHQRLTEQVMEKVDLQKVMREVEEVSATVAHDSSSGGVLDALHRYFDRMLN